MAGPGIDWVKYSPLTLFRFRGRIARSQFWFGSAVSVAVLAITTPLAEFLVEAIPYNNDYLFYTVAILLLSVPFLAFITIAVQRWHDRGKSGWLIIPFSILPATAGSVGDHLGPPLSFIINSLASLPTLWATIELGCLSGTGGPNRYGPDPLSQSGALQSQSSESTSA